MGQSTSQPFAYSLGAPEVRYSGVGVLHAGKKTAASGKACPPVSVFVMDAKDDVYAQEIKKLRSPEIS